MIVLQVVLCLLFPALALFLASRYKVFDFIGPVLLCYFVGMLIGNMPGLTVHTKTAETLTELTIPLAIPLLLFSANFKQWVKHSKMAVISFILAVVAVFIASITTTKLLGHTLNDAPHVAAMLAGTYTGGTPNLLSVGAALKANKDTIVLLNIADVIVSGSYLLFLMALAKPLLKRFYPAYRASSSSDNDAPQTSPEQTTKQKLWAWTKGLLLSLVVVGISVGGTVALFGKMEVAPIIFGITTGGILGSFVHKIQNIPGTYELGNYFILMFCVAIGTLTNFGKLVDASGSIVIFSCVLLTITVVLHYIFAAIVRIDVDTLIITSTASVMGPAFVGLVTESIGNRDVLLSGLTTGLVGYAVGNYLGLLIAQLL